MASSDVPGEPVAGTSTVSENSSEDWPPLPGAKSITFKRLRELFPAAQLLRKEINRRFVAGLGYAIDARRLFYTLRNLGNTDPAAFIARLDAEWWIVVAEKRGYGRLAEVARQVAILNAPLRSKSAGGS